MDRGPNPSFDRSRAGCRWLAIWLVPLLPIVLSEDPAIRKACLRLAGGQEFPLYALSEKENGFHDCSILMPSQTMPQLEEKAAPRLFISYSHDSAEHEDRVLALADRLRHDGIDALIDQYDTAPPDGWPMWMDREIQKADFVAMVCTETYLRRVEGRELPGKGRGVLWEAKLIYNSLYPEDSKVQKFIPVLFAGGQSSYIPLPIRGSTCYQVDSAKAMRTSTGTSPVSPGM